MNMKLLVNDLMMIKVIPIGNRGRRGNGALLSSRACDEKRNRSSGELEVLVPSTILSNTRVGNRQKN